MGATERWYYIEVVRHTENDGPRALRRGLEPHDERFSLREIKEGVENKKGRLWDTQLRDDLLKARVEIDEILDMLGVRFDELIENQEVTDADLLRKAKHMKKDVIEQTLREARENGVATIVIEIAEVDPNDYVRRLVEVNGGVEPNDDRASLFLGEGREEARKIGKEVNEMLGFIGMQKVHTELGRHLSQTALRELERAWDGIGVWLA